MKKLSAILVCLLMIVAGSLAGCATFSIDKVKYYNEVLAKVGDSHITRYDLLNAYSSYGQSYYVQQMGQSEEAALSSTLDLLIDRELMYQYATEHDDLYKPTAYQVNEVVKEIFDSIDEQMKSYIEKAKNVLNIEIEETEDEEKSSSSPLKYEDYVYTPRAKVKSRLVYYTDDTYETKSTEITAYSKNEYYIEYITEKEETTYEKLIEEKYLNNFKLNGVIEELKTKYFDRLFETLETEENNNATAIYNKVREYFAKDLINYEYYLRDENGNAYDKSTENLFNRYFKRTFESQIESQYLENIRTYYLENEELSIELLEKEYSYLATLDYNLYENDHEGYKDKMKNIGTDGNSIVYHPNTDAKFGYFIHTLISFDSIKDRLTALKEETDKEIYNNLYSELVKSVSVKARNSETGLIEEDATATSVADILTEYYSISTNYSNYNERLSAFIQFMFKYTNDTGTLSSGMPYVIGYNPSTYTGELTDGTLQGAYSAMVTEFTQEAIALMKKGTGSMSTGTLADMNSLCITDYGIHLLFYVGDVNSYDIPYDETANIYIQDEDVENDYAKLHNLYTKIINPLTKQTYFDKMFDLVYPASSGEVYTSQTGYDDFEKQIIEESKEQNEVVKYSTKIKGTKTNI